MLASRVDEQSFLRQVKEATLAIDKTAGLPKGQLLMGYGNSGQLLWRLLHLLATAEATRMLSSTRREMFCP